MAAAAQRAAPRTCADAAAPAYLYWGTDDELVPPGACAAWQHALGDVAALRRYEGEGHDVQYRHWDQILARRRRARRAHARLRETATRDLIAERRAGRDARAVRLELGGAMITEVFVTCAVTGAGDTAGRSEHVPVTPEQIADAAIEAARAGAAVVHIHVRDPRAGAAPATPRSTAPSSSGSARATSTSCST